MGRRKSRQSNNKEIASVSVNDADAETIASVSDDNDPLAILPIAGSSKEEKVSKKRASKGHGKKKHESKKDNQNGGGDVISEKSVTDDEEEDQEEDSEKEDDYLVPKKKAAKRKGHGKKKHASKKAKQNGDDMSEKSLDEDEQDKDDNEKEEADYEVQEILDVQYMKSGAREFLIRWKGFGSEGDTWEPEDNLSCPDLITKFLDKKTTPKKDPSKGKSKGRKRTKEAKKMQAVDVDPSSEFEVEKIIEVHHRRNGGKEFLIRWKGCSPDEDTWEPEENLCCPDLIEKFMQKVNKLSQFEKREVRTAPKHTDRFTLTMTSKGRRISKRNGDKQRATYYDAE